MGTVYCDGCGTSLDERARFCRACGKPTPLAESLSEATTKKFDEQPELRNLTAPVGASPTTPAYFSPSQLSSTVQTNGLQARELESKRHKRNIIILVSMMAVMILALAGLLAFLSFGLDRPAGPQGTPDPGFAGAPPRPPPPAIPGTAAPSRIDSSLIYPGSQQTMAVENDGKSVMKLHSNDSIKAVVDWYVARLNAPKKMSFVGQTVLQSGKMTVVIVGTDGAVAVIITVDSEQSSR